MVGLVVLKGFLNDIKSDFFLVMMHSLYSSMKKRIRIIIILKYLLIVSVFFGIEDRFLKFSLNYSSWSLLQSYNIHLLRFYLAKETK